MGQKKEVFNLINTRRLRDVEALDRLFDDLIALRQQIAKNAGFDNYRITSCSRRAFRLYRPDCYAFHDHSSRIVP